jgi:hypothetical protein
VADVSSDGVPDLVVIGVGKIRVMLGRGDRTFQGKADYPFSGTSYYMPPLLMDMNGDGRPDLVIPAAVEDVPDRIALFLGNGDGTFQDMQCVHPR